MLVGFAFAASAADSFQNPLTLVNSANGQNTFSYPTNGLYGTYISANVIVTNIVPLKNYPTDTTSLQITASATASTTTNLVVQIYSATAPVSLSINTNQGSNPGCVTNSATTPLAYFDTITLPLNGTTPVCTNREYTIASTPPKARGLNLYVYTIQMGAGTASVTNYSIVSSSQ